MNKITLNNIQMLRGVAALLVVCHHLQGHYIAMGGDLSIIKNISTWGFLGVDIFFIISGYIMAHTTFDKPRTLNSAKIFFKHRLIRIYLAYWVFFIITLLITYITNPFALENLNLIKSFFLLDTDMNKLVLPVSWSLTYEVYFYFIFLATFIFSVKILNKIIPIFFLILISLVLISTYTTILEKSFFYSPFLLEFFSGVLLYIYQDKIIKVSMLPVCIVVLLTTYYYGITNGITNGISRVLTFGLGGLSLISIFLILEKFKLYQARKNLVLLGDASYTIYLSHLVIISLFYFSGLRNLFSVNGVIFPLLGWFLIVGLVISFSVTYYIKIEKPIYKKAIQ